MKRLLILIFLALAFVAVLTPLTTRPELTWHAVVSRARFAPRTGWFSGFMRQSLALPLTANVNLDPNYGDNIHVTMSGPGADYVVVATVLASGPVYLVSMANADRRSRSCVPSGGSTICRIAFRIEQGGNALVTVSAAGAHARITDIRIKVAASREHAGATSTELLGGFGVLLVLGPLLALLRRWGDFDRNVQLALGLLWMTVTGWTGLAVNVAFALAGYALIHWVARRRAKTSDRFVTSILVVAFALVFIKFVAPYIAAAFANPGGFWFALPLGISYFAIRIVDLIFAVHARTLKAPDLRDYLSFLFLPYALPAGPILMYSDFLRARRDSYSVVDFSAGAARMAIGLTKKSVADAFLLPWINLEMLSFLDGGIGDRPLYIAAMLFLNTVYVYLDFSAYSDLAIGAGRAAGYTIPENFDWPLLRRSIRSFWQSWHMTLTQWVMRRVYFPSFLSSRSVPLSMYAAMLVIGMWHAPTLCWAMWAAHHTAALATQSRFFSAGPIGRAPPPATQARNGLRRYLTYVAGLVFVWAWVSLGHSFTMFSAPDIALKCYVTAISLPIEVGRLIVHAL